MYATQHSTPEIIERLLDNGAILILCVLIAMKMQPERIVNRIINDFEININGIHDGFPLLIGAVAAGRMSTVDILLKRGAKINIQANDVPLIRFALLKGTPEIMIRLLDEHPDVNVYYIGDSLIETALKNSIPQVINRIR